MDEFDVFDWAGNYIGRAVPVGSRSGEALFITIGLLLLAFFVAVFTAPLWIGIQIMRNGGWAKANSRTKGAFILSFLPWVLVAMQGVSNELKHTNVCGKTDIQIQGHDISVKSKFETPLHIFLSVNGGEEEEHLINMGTSHRRGYRVGYNEPVREVKLLRVFGYLGSPNKYISEYCNKVFYP